MSTDKNEKAQNLRVIDLSAAVLLRRYLRFWRTILFVAVSLFLIGVVLHPTVLRFVLLTLSAASYVLFFYPARWPILCWTWLWIVAAPAISAWLLWQMVVMLGDEFTFGLLVAFGDICLFFGVCTYVLRRPSIIEQEAEMKASQLFAMTPSFVERWLSGGWRTVFVLGMIWFLTFGTGPWSLALYTPRIGFSCTLFALALTGVMVMPWTLVPVSRALRNDNGMSLLRAILQNRKRALHGSYKFFVLRHVPERPSSIPWFTGSALIVIAAALCLGEARIRPQEGAQVEDVSFEKDLASSESPLLWGGTAATLFSLSLFCWRRGRQQVLRGELKLNAERGQPSTLYLRSFAEDQSKVLRDGLLFRVWLTDPFLTNIRFRRFEEVVAEAVWPFGGLVGLARPGDKLPELGAVRVAADPGGWKEKIERLMDECQRIIMTIGLTSGLKWEFEQARLQGRFAKLSLVVPPESASSIARSWQNLVSDLPALHTCAKDMVVRTVVVRFQHDGSPVLLAVEHRSVAAYRLALEACWLPLAELPAVEMENH